MEVSARMLSYFSVKGFKNFRDKLVFDLKKVSKYNFNTSQIKNGLLNKGIIYGKNGEGKSNLGQAIFDIEQNIVFTMNTLNSQNQVMASAQKGVYKSLGYNSDVEFEYHFQFDNDEIVYIYHKRNQRTITIEKLFINGNQMIDYKISDKTVVCSLKEAENFNFSNMMTGSSPLFFLFNFIRFEPNHPLAKLYKFIQGMLWFRCLNEGNEAIGLTIKYDFIEDAIIRNNKVEDFQKFLADYGINYNLDVMKVSRANGLILQNNNILVAKIGKEKAPLIQLLSTGTLALELFYYWSMSFNEVTFLFIDEFDAFYHYEISADIIKFLNKQSHFQSFVTTHNTSLMNTKLMRPDNLLLISHNKIKPLCDCTDGELREGHNLEKIYKEGGFDE